MAEKECFQCVHSEQVTSWHGLSGSGRHELEHRLQYKHLNVEDHATALGLLKGTLSRSQIPPTPDRVVRMYVCCNPSDMNEERNALQKRIFPELKAYCKEQYGYELQVLDPRWGIRDVITDNEWFQQGQQAELGRVAASQEHIFAIFLGEKLGYKPLPLTVTAEAMESVLACLDEQKILANLLKQWYWRDENACDPCFVLQKPKDILGNHLHQWKSMQVQIHKLLVTAVSLCQETQDDVPPALQELAKQLNSTAFEDEIEKCVSTDPERCLLFTRTISDLVEVLDRSRVSRYVDLLQNTNTIDNTKYEKCKNVRNILVQQIPVQNQFHQGVEWSEPYGVFPDDHKLYLDDVCCAFFAKCKELIDQACRQRMNDDLCSDSFLPELMLHWNIAKDLTHILTGRHTQLSRIKDYLMSDTEHPLVVYGKVGSGKSAVLAEAAMQIPEWLQESNCKVQATTVLRFCGRDRNSSLERTFLESVCQQIAVTSNVPRTGIPKSYTGLKNFFGRVVHLGEFRGMLVLILDDLDGLSEVGGDSAPLLEWFPIRTAPNVKVIVSANEQSAGAYASLRSKISSNMYFVEVEKMSDGRSNEFITQWLENDDRTLSSGQMNSVEDVVSQCGLPLHSQLLVQAVKTWSSYSHTLAYSCSLNTAVKNIFDKLEENHNKTFVSHALGFLTASEKGISETELEDLLSLDDDVLEAVYKNWGPSIKRFPPILWCMLKQELGWLLEERIDDGTNVIFWRHSTFCDIAKERCLDSSSASTIHSIFSSYFSGEWSGMKPKPYSYGRTNGVKGFVRFVAAQPLTYDLRNLPNLRKLMQWPTHLSMLKEKENSKSKEVIFSFDWLFTKIKHCSIFATIIDLRRMAPQSREIDLLANALTNSQTTLSVDPNMLGTELLGQLLPYYSSQPNLKRLLDQCDLAGQRHCSLVPMWQNYLSPGGPLEYEAKLPEKTVSCDLYIIENAEFISLVHKPLKQNQMLLWDLQNQEMKPSITAAAESRINQTRNGQFYVSIAHERYLCTQLVTSGQLFGQIEFDDGKPVHLAMSNRYVAFTVDQKHGPYLADIEAQMLLHRFQYACKAVDISSDEKYLVCSTGNGIAFHEMPLLARICAIKTKELPMKILCGNKPLQFFVMFQSKEVGAYSVNCIHKRADYTSLLRDFEAVDLKMSSMKNHLVVRSERCLYIIKTGDLKVLHTLTKPKGPLPAASYFTDAGLTKHDEIIVATIENMLCLWENATGQLVRILAASENSIEKLFLPLYYPDKAVTITSDQKFQVWNLNSFKENIITCPAHIAEPVEMVAATEDTVVYCGQAQPVAKVFSLKSGKVMHNLVHTEYEGCKILDTQTIPNSELAITKGVVINKLTREVALESTALWNLNSGERIYHVGSVKHVVVTSDGGTVAFFHRTKGHSQKDICTDISILSVHDRRVSHREIPEDCEVLCPPIFTEDNSSLVFVLSQAPPEEVDSDQPCLCRMSSDDWESLKYMSLEDVFPDVLDMYTIIGLRNVSNSEVMIIMGKEAAPKSARKQRNSKTKEKSLFYPEVAVIVDLEKKEFVRQIDSYLCLDAAVDSLFLSSDCSLGADSNLNVYDMTTGKKKYSLATLATPQQACFLFKGEYIVSITELGNEIVVRRSSNGVVKTRCFTHCKATCLTRGHDDRSVMVGCTDGRLLIFCLVLNDPDPVTNFIKKLPSRDPNGVVTTALQSDIHNLKMKQVPFAKPLDSKEVSKLLRRPGSRGSSAASEASRFSGNWSFLKR